MIAIIRCSGFEDTQTIAQAQAMVNIALHSDALPITIEKRTPLSVFRELPGFRSRGIGARLFEKPSVMPIPPQIVVGFFLFVADAFPDHSSFPPVEIPALVARAQRGDRSAIALLYQIHSQRIFRYIVTRVPTIADAEDLTADVFIRMVKGLPSYQVTGVPFEAWLYRIAASRVTDFYRKDNRHSHVELNDTLSDRSPLPEEQIEQGQSLDHLREALKQLPEDHQLILILRFVERKSHQEVAEILGKSVPAIKSAQHRALIHLTELLGSSQKARHYLRGSHE